MDKSCRNDAHKLWSTNCLTTIAVLTRGLGERGRRRLARRFDLLPEAECGDPVAVLRALHDGCHCHDELARTVTKKLDERFSNNIKLLRNEPAEEIRTAALQWPFSRLWAALRDDREEVQIHARHKLHELYLHALDDHMAENGDAGADPEIGRMEASMKALRLDQVRLQRENRKQEETIARLRDKLAAQGGAARTGGAAAEGAGKLKREIKKLKYELEKALAASGGTAGPSGPDEAGRCEKPGCACGRNCPDAALCPDEYGGSGRGGSRCEAAGCPCPLRDVKVAVVGGLDRLAPKYEAVVNELGAECLIHNGKVHDGAYRLRNLICQSDIVIYITSINNHLALKIVKGECKKTGKRFVALKETGVNSLKQSLLELAG